VRRALAGRPPFDLAIDFQGNWRSALWVYLSRAKVKAGRGGIRPGWALSFRPDKSRHAVRVCASVLELLGVPMDDLNPEVVPSAVADGRVRELLGQHGLPEQGFLVINPFSRWASKAWPVECYAELVARVRAERLVRVVITGGPAEIGPGRDLEERLQGQALNLVGRLSLEESICLYGRAGMMVTGDSGPMHIAAALGKRVIALFGPTLPEQTGPWGQLDGVIQIRRPPQQRAYRTDPLGSYIRAIPVEAVVRAVLEALDRPPHPGVAPAA
jgi:ADP-heptose:LPS heptosyltransferase